MRRVPALALALACAGPAVTAPAPLAAARQVVVVSPSGSVADAAGVVTRAGGRVVARLPLAGAVVARVRGTLPPPVVVAEDRTLRVAGLTADATGASTVRSTLGLAATGTEGAGVTVALVDTGVADVADLPRVEHADVTGTGGGDAYGHGTFMAGLIAGNGASSGGRYTGIAPGARLLDVKVADGTGATTLSTVLRGLEVVAARPDVKVLNLSLSSGSPLPWQLDPLTRALDALWRRGVTVVVPSGNDGPDARTIASPGVDPTLLTVAAVDENGTADRSDDTVPGWSSRGPAPQDVAKPDLAAPGAHVVSLRAPGSAVDAANPDARVENAYFRGSGTSMATAVTSGAVAALLSARGWLAPDAVKNAVTTSTYDAPGLASYDAAGTGGLDLAAAYDAKVRHARLVRAGRAGGDQELAFAELARAWAAGDYDAAARAWALLDPQARAWAARAWAAFVWQRANSWSTSEWMGRAWAARAWAADDEWLGRAWAARAWADTDWAGRAWSARAWAARAWSDGSWSARAWSDDDWAGRAWAADGWAARAWTGRAWTGDDWAGRSWSARGWAAASWGP
ncbi:MAG TPA: S8 family serine peptidase [Mycobacteriales bacterium]|jgi:serine protease AprX|nr:S8 family serine peptidase [Mycobacteriales bacterium]